MWLKEKKIKLVVNFRISAANVSKGEVSRLLQKAFTNVRQWVSTSKWLKSLCLAKSSAQQTVRTLAIYGVKCSGMSFDAAKRTTPLALWKTALDLQESTLFLSASILSLTCPCFGGFQNEGEAIEGVGLGDDVNLFIFSKNLEYWVHSFLRWTWFRIEYDLISLWPYTPTSSYE